jgi:hypothetical protein
MRCASSTRKLARGSGRKQLMTSRTSLAARTRVRKAFGRYAERDWWGKHRNGRDLTMPQLIDMLSEAERFRPRFKGETPVLHQYYALQHKAWTQALHHTAAGLDLRPAASQGFPVAVARPAPYLILFGNYWVFAQSIFAALDLGAREVADYFEKLFLSGLAVFLATVGIDVPWADNMSEWAAETD